MTCLGRGQGAGALGEDFLREATCDLEKIVCVLFPLLTLFIFYLYLCFNYG